MIIEHYNGLTWEVDELPIGSSTPDEFYELSYRAYATCPNGHKIEGVANYWSRDETMILSWLDSIHYDECEQCESEEEEEYDDEFEDEEIEND